MINVKKIRDGKHYKDAIRVAFPYDVRILAKIKELEERRYIPEDKEWEIPAYSLPIFLASFNGSEIVRVEKSLQEELERQEVALKRVEAGLRLKDISPAIPLTTKTKPLPHQIEAFNWGLDRTDMLIGDDQGLGKTFESIAITTARKSIINKCLIVCGVNSVKYNWEAEIKIHSHEKSVIFDDKTMEKRVASINDWYKSNTYYGIINIESLRNEHIQDALYVGIKDGILGCIIVDEIHKAKNGSSQQGKALRRLNSQIRIGLTGTPIMSKAEDLWNILTWLRAEKRSFYTFKNTYCNMGGYGGYKVVSHKNLDSLNLCLNQIMIRRKKEEVLDLPPKIYATEYVELTRKQMLLYKDIKRGIIEHLEEILTTLNPLTSMLKLRQLTGGMFTEDNPKLERIMDMLEEEIIPNGYKAIIFSQWESITDIYVKALKKYNPAYIIGKVDPEDRQGEVNRFQNDPSCKVIIGTIGAMGTGLTLNKASYVFFTDKAWTSAENAQAEDRAHRIGTTGTVNIISMVAKNTIDEGIEDYLAENKALFDRIVDGKGSSVDMRALINKLLKL